MAALTLRGRLLLPDGVLRYGELAVEGRHIATVRALEPELRDEPAGDPQIIAPGFIDLQINGAFGCDFTARPETVYTAAALLPRSGVTAFLPTLVSAPLETYRAAFALLAPEKEPPGGAGAQVLGWHLEGPYLSPQRPGAHDRRRLRPRADPQADGLLDRSVRLMTLAPELENGLAAIRDLRERGIAAALGHSAASFAQTVAALDAGARLGTHLFNAMPPLHHREPGPIGALLADERATAGLIADGVHLHPSLFGWLVRAKGAGRIALVSDAMAAAGLGPGEYRLGERPVQVDATSARLADGTLAGSLLTMDQAVRNLVAWGACTPEEALRMASAVPARLLGDEQRGRIAAGCRADLVVLDARLHVRRTMVGGEYFVDPQGL